MACLYTAFGSFHVLRLKNKVKLLTQNAQNRICMGKWAWESLEILFLKDEKAPDDREESPRKLFEKRWKKQILSQTFFDFRKNDYV